MKFPLYIAQRFLLGGKGAGPSRFTGWIAIIGIAAGAFAMILALAVLNGFEGRVAQKISGIEGDVRLEGNFTGLEGDRLEALLTALPFVTGISPYQQRRGLLLGREGERRVVTFKAVAPGQVEDFYRLELETSSLTSPYPDVYIGQVLAHRLNIQVGDYVRLLSPLDDSGGLGLPRQVKGFVRGIFKAQVLDYDDRLVYLPTAVGKTLFTRKKGLDGVDLRLHSPGELAGVVTQLKALLPPDITVRSYTDLHEGLFQAMRMERLGSLAILSLIILVACFNLASTLVLVAYQKIREIGILRTLGTSARGIQRIILTQGLMVGGVGLVAGLMLGLGLVWVQQRLGIFPLPEEIYFMNTVPMVLFPRDVVVVPLIALGLILVSAYLASRRAVLIQPKEAVHMEK